MLRNSGKQPHLMITSGSHLENLQSMVLYEASFQKSEPAQPSYLLLCLKGLQTPTVPRGTCSVCDMGTHATSVQVRGQLGAFSFLHPLCFEAKSLSFLTLCVNSRLRIFHVSSKDQAHTVRLSQPMLLPAELSFQPIFTRQ